MTPYLVLRYNREALSRRLPDGTQELFAAISFPPLLDKLGLPYIVFGHSPEDAFLSAKERFPNFQIASEPAHDKPALSESPGNRPFPYSKSSLRGKGAH